MLNMEVSPNMAQVHWTTHLCLSIMVKFKAIYYKVKLSTSWYEDQYSCSHHFAFSWFVGNPKEESAISKHGESISGLFMPVSTSSHKNLWDWMKEKERRSQSIWSKSDHWRCPCGLVQVKKWKFLLSSLLVFSQ